MPTAPNHILIVNDSHARRWLEQQQELFPTASVVAFTNKHSAIEYLEQGGSLPDLLVIDCFNESYGRGGGQDIVNSIIDYLQINQPAALLPHIAAQSAELNFAKQNVRNLLQHDLRNYNQPHSPMIIAAEITELYTIQRFLDYGLHKRDVSDWDEANGWRQLLNDVYGFDLPLSKVEAEERLGKNSQTTPETILDQWRYEEISTSEAAQQLVPYVPAVVHAAYTARLDPAAVAASDVVTLQFQVGSGQPIQGVAALSYAEATALKNSGQQPILILPDDAVGDEAIVAQFQAAAALVCLRPETGAHIVQLAAGHGVPVVASYQEAEDSAVLFVPADNITSSKLVLQAGDKTHHITSGDALTLDPANSKLYCGNISIIPSQPEAMAWLTTAKAVFSDWHDEQGIAPLTIKDIVNSTQPSQIPNNRGGRPIGIIRTERLIEENSSALAAYRAFMLLHDLQAAETLREQQQQALQPKLRQLRHGKHHSVRVRLPDAPAAEFFAATDLPAYKSIYGDDLPAGVALSRRQAALGLPNLYELALHATISAYAVEQRKLDIPLYPIEILVPQVTTTEDMRFVRQMATSIAIEQGIDESQLRYGAMLETVAAGKNMAAIAPLCDFLSIGGNDLTAELLECPRNDWRKRNELTIASQCGEDPFVVIHPAVVKWLEPVLATARKVKPTITIDFCGSQGTDLTSLNRMRPLGLNGIAVVPTARNIYGLPLLYAANTVQQTLQPIHPQKNSLTNISTPEALP